MCQDDNSARDGDNSDESSDEEIFRLVLEDDDNDFMNGMLLYIIHHDKYCNIRAKRRKPMLIELEWVERKLGDRNSYYNMFRMSPTVFHRLHDLLVESYGLKFSTKSTSVEALGMFLWMLGAPQLVRQAEDRFKRSLCKISRSCCELCLVIS